MLYFSSELVIKRRRTLNETRAQANANDSISFKRLMTTLGRHFILVIIWTVLLGLLGFGVSKFVIVPKYTATTEILVNQKRVKNADIYNTQQADVQMINTYKDLITNQVILSQVRKQLSETGENGYRYKMTNSELKKSIKITNQQNSQVFSVNVTTGNPNMSAAVANAIAAVFTKKIKKIMSVNNVTLVSRAYAPSKPSFPNVTLVTVIAAIIGFIGSIIYLIMRAIMDSSY